MTSARSDPPPAVLFEKRGAVAEIVLNRPDALNAYNTNMRDGLYEALTAVRDDPEIAVAVLFGNGRAFCTGGDLAEFGSAPSPTAARSIRWQRDVWGTLWELPQVTIAGVHGPVVGGGFELTMLCDQCVAASNATFSLPETGLAMIPGVGGTQTLSRLAGLTPALAINLTGAVVDAGRARDLGWVQRVVDASVLRERTRALARRIAAIPAPLRIALKRLVNDGPEHPLESALTAEGRVEASLR